MKATFARKYYYLVLLLFFFTECGKNVSPQIGDQAVTTPHIFHENKVLFLEPNSGEQAQRNKKLFHTFEIKKNLVSEIKPLEPIGCVVRGVRIPVSDDFIGKTGRAKKDSINGIDIAVVLDIVTAGSESLTSLVVFYQRNVRAGQMLNFQDLLVYYDPEWDGLTPPYFRIRVLDVKAEQNQRTRNLLDKVGNLTGLLNGVIPHPVIPAVQTGIQAAKEIFGNSKNRILIDYQVQFYSPAQIEGSLTKLTPLRKGEWAVVGREKKGSSSFWDNTFLIDQKTGQLKNEKNLSSEVNVPYVLMTLFSADASIPKFIMDRSKVLVDVLSSSSERNNLDALSESVTSLQNSVEVYKLERRFKKYFSVSDLRAIKDKIEENVDSESLNISIEQLRSLIRVFNQVTNSNCGSAEAVITWWQSHSNGSILQVEKSNEYPLGYKYE